MSESSPETEEEFGSDDCDVCGDPLDKYGTARFAELSSSDPMTLFDKGFCSWEHLCEWMTRGEPVFVPYSAYEPLSRRKRFGSWATDTGALILIVMWSALGAFGLYTLGHLIF